MNKIHKTAIIENNVILGDNIEIGAYSVISGNVTIGDNNIVKSHTIISGNTKIGKNNIFYPFSNIGDVPQDLKFTKDELSFVEIGDNNIIRENVTIHSGTALGNEAAGIKNLTKIGNNNLLMVGTHIAHDCLLKNNIVIANNSVLAGHVSIGNNVIIGGLSAIKQFIRVGDYAIIGGMSGVESDVLPYALIMGERANLAGINIVGLKRNGFSKQEISLIKKVTDSLFANNDMVFQDKVNKITQTYQDNKTILLITDFLSFNSKQAICKPKRA